MPENSMTAHKLSEAQQFIAWAKTYGDEKDLQIAMLKYELLSMQLRYENLLKHMVNLRALQSPAPIVVKKSVLDGRV
jgi:hypothetical protein